MGGRIPRRQRVSKRHLWEGREAQLAPRSLGKGVSDHGMEGRGKMAAAGHLARPRRLPVHHW